MSQKLKTSRPLLLLFILITASLWSISKTSNALAAPINSAAPTTSLYVMQDFESGGAVIQSWWNSTVTTEGPNAANAYEGDYYGRIVVNGAGSTNPIFQDDIWSASQIDISSYERVCMWVFDETTIAGTHLGLVLRNSDDSQNTSQLRSIQSTSPGEWRKMCWPLADFDNQTVMTQFFAMILFADSLPEKDGNNIDGGPFRIDYVHFEGPVTINCAANEVGGRIFLDQNSNTLNEEAEVGYSGATVTIYDNTGASDTVTTDASGYYSSTAFNAGTDLRVELTVPSGYESAAAGNTSVLFTQSGTCEQDIGIYQTARYCEANPQMATACYVAGTHDGDNAGMDAIVSFPYDASGVAHDGSGTTPVHAALVGDVGTTWGMGYQRQTETLYTTAFVKRLSDLGPLGTGGIYKLDYSNPTAPVVSNFVNISVTLSIDTGPDPRDGSLHNATLPISGMVPVRDQNAYENVGKVSMGDMDISDDGNTMWFVNLYDQSLYGITNLDPNTPPVPGDVLGPYDIAAENPGCDAGSDVRPWGLNYTDNTVYVGLVCSAESTGQAADLHAYVLAFDPATSSFNPTPVVDFSLDNKNGCIYWFTQPDACSWRPWGSTEHVEGTNAEGFNSILNPQPILADIEFDSDGSMIIAFMDRHGHQSGLQNYSGDLNDSNPNYGGMAGGDIVRVCNNNGTFELEQGGICPNGNTEYGYGGSVSGLQNGIYGTAEYYKDDFRENDPTHAETAHGGLALHPSAGEVVFSSMNPLGNINSGGVRWNSNTTGLRTRGYELYQEFLPDPTFGKANGIGDVELLCSLPELEVGNRVWHDSDLDGIQDPGEPVLPNVVVELLDSTGTVIATATTDANGLYLFSSGLPPATPSTGAVYNVAGLSPNTAGYTVRIAQNDAALGVLNMTTSNVQGDTTNSITDLRDSDAIASGNYAIIPFDTGTDGANNHTLDFGFAAIPQVIIGDRVWIEDDNDGDATTGNVTPVVGATVTATGSDGSVYTGVTDGTGNYSITVPANTVYTVTISTPFGTTPAGTLITTDNDPTTQNDLSHDGSGTVVTVGAVDNLTIDFGFYESPPPPPCSTDPDDLGGTIWRDYDSDGIQDALEPGFAGVTVTAYDNDGNAVTTPVNADGTYNFSDIFATETHIRLEFSGLPAWMESSVQGANNGTTVQIHTAATCDADLAVQEPADYCQENPYLSTACYVYGNQITGTYALSDTIVTINAGWGTTTGLAYDLTSWQVPSPPIHTALANEVGTTWGMAWKRDTSTLFAAAFMKQFVGFGPDGPGAIYKMEIDPATGQVDPSTIDLFVDVTDFPSVTMCADLHGTDMTPLASGGPVSNDTRFDAVGKCSFGDMEISGDDSTLYVMNLSAREILVIDANSGNLLTQWPVPTSGLPNNSTSGTCDDNDVRPFALGYHNGQLYAGAVCSAETTEITIDLHYYVWTVDTSSGLYTPIFDHQINQRYFDYWIEDHAEWRNKIGNGLHATHYQPMLTDIEFYGEDLILGTRVRDADQWGHWVHDPILDELATSSGMGTITCVAYDAINDTYTIEENAQCGDRTASGVGLEIGRSSGEQYYWGDGKSVTNGTDPHHHDIAFGGLAQYGLENLQATAMGPADAFGIQTASGGGILELSNENGAPVDGYALYRNPNAEIGGAFGKANGLGDLEALCLPAPLEIGNYVWLDEDEDGIQDPCEPAIPGVDVVLTATDGTTQTVTTDANGEYYFPVEPDSAYTLTIDMTQPALITYTLTTPNVDAGTTLTDGIDSDAVANGNLAVITLTTGKAGQNDHTFDFGFYEEPPATIAIVKKTIGDDGTFTFSSLEPDFNTLSITTAANMGVSSVITKSAGTYTITEDALAGWNLTAITVTESLINNSSVMLGDSLANLVVEAGEHITVTFQNQLMIADPITVGNYVWVDVDMDGIQDSGEPVLSGVQVELRTITGTLIATTTTDANGLYTFTDADGMAPSTNYLIVIPDDDPVLNAGGYTATMPDQGSDDDADSDAVYLGDKGGMDWVTDGTSPFDHAIEITSPISGANLTYDFGFTGAIEHDCNSNSTITVQSIGLGGLYASHAYTYTIPNSGNVIGVIAEAAWRVHFDGTTLPTEVTFTGSNGITATVSGGKLLEPIAYNNDPTRYNTTLYRSYLAGNMSSVTLTTPMDGSGDPFAFNLYVIRSSGGEGQASNLFFIDKFTGSADNDLPQNATTLAPLATSPVSSDYTFLAPIGEAGTAGAEINLSAGGVDNSGNDLYPEPNPNPYGSDVYLQEMLLTGVPANTSSLTVYQSEAPSSNSSFILTGVMATAESCHEDVLIGDRVWIEDDNDGNATTGVITPVVGSLVTAIDSNGIVYTDTTDVNGLYTITVPANMTYTVSVGTPSGTVPTPLTGGNTITDTASGNNLSHDGNGTTVIVGTEDNLTIDFGFYELPPAMPGLALSKTLSTPEPVSVGQPISFTIRITNTGNVTITQLPLVDTYDTTYLAYDSVNGSTPATDDNGDDGQLDWSDLTVTEGDLGPGSVIEVVTHFAAKADTAAVVAQAPCVNNGESCNSAAVNGAMAGPDPVPPVNDSDDVEIEELITGKSTLGDFVWFDANSDGIKDPGETGINGVIINLYDSSGLITMTVTMSDTNGVGDDTGVSNGDGFYDFEVLPSTVYTVEIDPSNFAPGGALEGYTYTGNNATQPYNGDETRVVGMPAIQHDENNVDFSYVAPTLFELSKTLNTPGPARVGDTVSFTIQITNTGAVVMTQIPLADTYNNAFLNYITASPEPDNPATGQLVWNDLTAAGGTGFGVDLHPGETFEVVVEFVTQLDTTGLPNESTLNIASSQGVTDTAEVQAFAPTSVEFIMREVTYQNDKVVVQWQTADESDVVGFHIYRAVVGDGDGEPIKLTPEMMIAQKSGSASGASYTYEDESAEASVDYRYFVGIFDTKGFETQQPLGEVLTQRTVDDWFIFLPITMK